MAWVLGFIGALLGLMAGASGAWAVGMLGGALIGALLGAYLSMRDRIAALEHRLRHEDARMRVAQPADAYNSADRTAPSAAATAAAAPRVVPVQFETVADETTEHVGDSIIPAPLQSTSATDPQAPSTTVNVADDLEPLTSAFAAHVSQAETTQPQSSSTRFPSLA